MPAETMLQLLPTAAVLLLFNPALMYLAAFPR